MITLSNKEIRVAIQRYQAILQDPDELIKFFEHGYCFYYEKQHYGFPSATMHAYPAIHNETPMFLVIPSHYDVESKADSIHEYVVGCTLTPQPLKGNRIPPEEAMIRIDLWKAEFKNWIPQQVANENGMFQVVQISRIDFETQDNELYMGLKLGGDEGGILSADMIVMSESKVTHFDDFSTMIPPYGPSAASSSFYLLTL